MPQPSAQAVHANRPLTNISIAYIQDQTNFIAGRVFPTVPVASQSDTYYTYTKADWFRDEAEKRADATESVGSGYGLSSTSFFCDVVAIHKDVGDQARGNADAGIDLDRDAAEFVTQRLLVKQEVDWTTAYFSTGVWGTTVTPTNKWSDYTSSDPISDIEAGIETILSNTGFKPNTLVLGYAVMRFLKHHPDIVDRIKYTGGPSSNTMQALAQLVGVDRILTAMSIRNTAAEGATASYSFNQDANDALLCYVNPRPSLLAPSAGYNFSWRGVPGGLGGDINIRRFRMEKLRADRVEGEVCYDHKLVASDLGYFFDEAST